MTVAPVSLDPLADDVPAVDLRTLLGEMAALKAEVRAETQAARSLRDDAARGLARADEEIERARAREAALQRALDDERRRATLVLIDLADRMEAALRVAERPAPTSLFRRPDPRVPGLAEGLRMTLSRVSDRLASAGVKRVETRGRPFDARLMEGIETRHAPGRPAGEVLEELVAGYIDAAGVLRAAQVVVNQTPGAAPPALERQL